jgi:hypothetical protein
MQNTKKTKTVADTNIKVNQPTPQAPTVLLTQSQSTQKQALLIAKQNVANGVTLGTGVTHHTAGNIIKGLLPQAQIAKPTLAMCRYIQAIPTFKYMQGQCQHRKHLYIAGCTLLHAKLTLGLTPNDLTYWHSIGAVNLVLPTTAQYNAIVTAWQQGLLIPNTYCQVTGNLLTQGTYTTQAIINIEQ